MCCLLLLGDSPSVPVPRHSARALEDRAVGGLDAARRSATTRPVPGRATGSPGSDRTHNMATFPRPPRTHRPRRCPTRTKVAAVLVGAVSVLTAATLVRVGHRRGRWVRG